MHINSNPALGALGLINARKKILWVWTGYIEGECKKDTLNDNLSMVMYALVHKLLKMFLKRNPNPKKIILWNRGKLKSKSKIFFIMKQRKTTSHIYLSFNYFKIYEAHHIISFKYRGKQSKKEKGKLL
jgi:hypothetical protein